MKKFKNTVWVSILICIVLTLYSCRDQNDSHLTIKEVEFSSNDTITRLLFSFKKGKSYHFSTKTSKKRGNDKLTDVNYTFDKEQLSAILNTLKYSYKLEELPKNPILEIDYFKENTTEEQASEELITQLKNIYHFH